MYFIIGTCCSVPQNRPRLSVILQDRHTIRVVPLNRYKISVDYVLSLRIDAGYALHLITATDFAMCIRVFIGSTGPRYSYVATLY